MKISLTSDRAKRYEMAWDGVANTPLLSIELPSGCKVFCKDESRNPSGSHYDRIFPVLLQCLEESRTIIPYETELVDATTGNAGAALARAAQILGYRCTIVIPEDMPLARVGQIQQYGAQVILSPAGMYVAGAVRELKKYLISCRKASRDVFCIDHSRRPEAAAALEHTAAEILGAINGKRLDYFVGVIGNGLTIKGIGMALRQQVPTLKVIGVEPFEAPSNYVKTYPGRFEETYGTTPDFRSHGLLGAGAWDVHFPFIDLSMYDEIVLVREADWSEGHQGFRSHRVVPGRTSVACLWVASEVARARTNLRFVQILYDAAWKYGAMRDGGKRFV